MDVHIFPLNLKHLYLNDTHTKRKQSLVFSVLLFTRCSVDSLHDDASVHKPHAREPCSYILGQRYEWH